jgi:hypothetical protein
MGDAGKQSDIVSLRRCKTYIVQTVKKLSIVSCFRSLHTEIFKRCFCRFLVCLGIAVSFCTCMVFFCILPFIAHNVCPLHIHVQPRIEGYVRSLPSSLFLSSTCLHTLCAQCLYDGEIKNHANCLRCIYLNKYTYIYIFFNPM